MSVVHHAAAVLRAGDPVLEANAFAIAEDVDLALLLRADAVELALAAGAVEPGRLAGVELPPVAASQDLHGLVESGVAVHAEAGALERRGVRAEDLIDGVRVVDDRQIAELLVDADAVLRW